MEIRQLEKWDRAGLVRLLTHCLTEDQISDGLVWEKVWGDSRLMPNMTLVVAENEHLFGFIMGVVCMGQQGPYGAIKILCVGLEHRGKGIASDLLERVESRFKEMGIQQVRVGESPPNYLWAGIDVRYTEALVFFKSRGYHKDHEVYDMKVPLIGLDLNVSQKEKALDQSFQIRRAVPQDHDELVQFLKAYWPDWSHETEICFHNEPISVHLALYQERIVAFAAHNANNRETGNFGPMGTASVCRKKGIGRILLKRCLLDIRNAGFIEATIPWVGPFAFYNKAVGARISRVLNRYQKTLN